jgi:hypothetical protein
VNYGVEVLSDGLIAKTLLVQSIFSEVKSTTMIEQIAENHATVPTELGSWMFQLLYKSNLGALSPRFDGMAVATKRL